MVRDWSGIYLGAILHLGNLPESQFLIKNIYFLSLFDINICNKIPSSHIWSFLHIHMHIRIHMHMHLHIHIPYMGPAARPPGRPNPGCLGGEGGLGGWGGRAAGPM